MCYDHYYADYAMKIWLLYFGLYFVLGNFFGILTGGGQTNWLCIHKVHLQSLSGMSVTKKEESVECHMELEQGAADSKFLRALKHSTRLHPLKMQMIHSGFYWLQLFCFSNSVSRGIERVWIFTVSFFSSQTIHIAVLQSKALFIIIGPVKPDCL